jgi:hypothetical protein
MSVQSEVAHIYELMRWKGASEETACAVAMALYRELVPGSGYAMARKVVARAVETLRVGRVLGDQAKPRGGRPRRAPFTAPTA